MSSVAATKTLQCSGNLFILCPNNEVVSLEKFQNLLTTYWSDVFKIKKLTVKSVPNKFGGRHCVGFCGIGGCGDTDKFRQFMMFIDKKKNNGGCHVIFDGIDFYLYPFTQKSERTTVSESSGKKKKKSNQRKNKRSQEVTDDVFWSPKVSGSFEPTIGPSTNNGAAAEELNLFGSDKTVKSVTWEDEQNCSKSQLVEVTNDKSRLLMNYGKITIFVFNGAVVKDDLLSIFNENDLVFTKCVPSGNNLFLTLDSDMSFTKDSPRFSFMTELVQGYINSVNQRTGERRNKKLLYSVNFLDFSHPFSIDFTGYKDDEIPLWMNDFKCPVVKEEPAKFDVLDDSFPDLGKTTQTLTPAPVKTVKPRMTPQNVSKTPKPRVLNITVHYNDMSRKFDSMEEAQAFSMNLAVMDIDSHITC